MLCCHYATGDMENLAGIRLSECDSCFLLVGFYDMAVGTIANKNQALRKEYLHALFHGCSSETCDCSSIIYTTVKVRVTC